MQKKYTKKHQNKTIKDYGFTKKQILSDFDFVYQNTLYNFSNEIIQFYFRNYIVINSSAMLIVKYLVEFSDAMRVKMIEDIPLQF